MTTELTDEQKEFVDEVNGLVSSHQIIQNNPYTKWFKDAELKKEEVSRFTVQFSVFSNLFLIAQLKKMLSANNLASMRAAKEILVNELGVSFKNDSEGHMTVEGGQFRWKAAHFEWLIDFAKPLGLTFDDLGQRHHGDDETLYFCDKLSEIYGNSDYSIGAGASFAVENWANMGFWKELIQGLDNFKQAQLPELKLGFFTWHDEVEESHAENTQDELIELLQESGPALDRDKFLKAANDMLDAVNVFWVGLDKHKIV